MLKKTTRGAALGTAVFVASAALIAIAPAASATQTSTSCVGTLVQDTPLKGDTSGKTLGDLEIYWDSSTGQNCAETVSSSATWGTAKSMTVEIWECKTDTAAPSSDCTAVSGTGENDFSLNYKYYAGPVSAPGSGHCVDVYGQIIMPNGDYADYDTGTSHC